MKRKKLTHQFVELIPDQLREGVLYISFTYNTALHKCCCGCGNQVVTPISPVHWTIGYDGRTVTLKPSIGNYSFDCQSHYWITNNRVEWVPAPSSQKIAEDREADRRKRLEYLERDAVEGAAQTGEDSRSSDDQDSAGWWRSVRRWLADR